MKQTLFNKIQTQYGFNLPFVAYKKPKTDVLTGVFQEDNTLHLSTTFNESGFVMAPFNMENQSVIIPFDKVIEERYISENTNESGSIANNEAGKEDHISLVEKGVEFIKKGEFEKVVLSRKESVLISEKSPIDLFEALLNTYLNAFVYVWYHPKVGCWLGATPEVLLSTHAKRFKTMALAGTQLYKEEVAWGNKEKQEQQFVTDFIIGELNTVTNKLQVSEPYTVQAGKLAHIRTDITGSFNVSLKEVIERLHPTPAVCGLPKKAAKNFIMKNETYDREYYTGFLGELNKPIERRNNRRNTENKAYQFSTTESNLFVNLRCMQYENNQVAIYVGGGITKDSNPEMEFQETVNKTSTMKKVLLN
ncbi:chorismate-binding protein [Pseudofulvibacter geojedonensis]|uniref:Chorismate-binding protein n=1 Tax=Pseudofulvibacter geojedonensis TaxID=1123758 RepID=A0ABW3I3N7_9FLAO